ncbi:FAD-binding oxidoreductase [Maritalea mediterranea]|uniref:FAD-binding oxidoreductase n=1 Tax=Maritalea mediterranea TaxID=2909667 RepID=A0ABS9E8T9_9HYPH|nr:FAD-binding oxidoreductase [Maritalea mediterranea]MCF4097876.1 FAD-binding oxidoreductase [Maritalea mediterranea]
MAPAQPFDKLLEIVGEANFHQDEGALTRFLEEPRGLYKKGAQCAVTPTSVKMVQKVMQFAYQNEIAVVPQSGNTGLVGGQVPATGKEIILSLSKLRQVREVDTSTNVMTLEAGITVLEAQKHAEEADRLFPLSLGSEGSCQIGGILSTNAGGTAVLAYGNSRDLCMGVEAVLADGRLYKGLSKLRKDNTGYDLKDLLVGAEGTLGIITAASMKMFPRPRAFETALLNIASPQVGVEVFEIVRKRAGNRLTSFELLPTIGMDLQLKHELITRDPRAKDAPTNWHILLELSLFEGDEDGALLGVLEELAEKELVADASLCNSLGDRQLMWLMRENYAECQNREAQSIKHDISVAIRDIPTLMDEVDAAAERIVPGIRPIAFGHMGDGNIHYDFLAPEGFEGDFKAFAPEIHKATYEILAKLNGSISAEHGIGQMKADLLAQKKDPTALDMMKSIKLALDPKNILNPGKILRS